MTKFPKDVPQRDVIKTFMLLGFKVVRAGNHISMERYNQDGSNTPLTMPNHIKIKGSTLRSILTQTGITREQFLKAYEKV